MKTRFSLTIDENVYDTIKLQATVLDMPVSRYVNKILRDHLNLQNKEIENALVRLEAKRQLEVQGHGLEGPGAGLETDDGSS